MNDEAVKRTVRTGRIIVAAMFVGALTAVIVLVTLVETGTKPVDPGMSRILLTGAGFLAIAETVGYVVLRTAVIRQLRAKEAPAESAPGHYATLVIIGGAMAEGLALFAGVIYFMTGATAALGLAALALALLIFQFPSAARVQRFADKLSA
jgi:hypothetical protein